MNHFLPTCWEDLSQANFVKIFTAALTVVNGPTTIEEFRLCCLKMYVSDEMISYHFKHLHDKRKEQLIAYRKKIAIIILTHLFSRNRKELIRLAKEAYYPLKIDWQARTEELTEKLLLESANFSWVFKQKEDSVFVLNTDFKNNPVPELYGYCGAYFRIGHIVETNLTAKQFNDIYEVAAIFADTKNDKYLDILISILYTHGHGFHKQIMFQTAIEGMDYAVKMAVYMYFNNIVSFFYNHPDYSLLFSSRSSSRDQKLKVSGESIFRLSAAGYGSVPEVENMNLLQYFDLQLSDLKTNIQKAIAAGRNPSDIASSTGISGQTISILS